ncbi:MAG: nitroreductase family protein [Chloroflexi bacterium]|nr:nitroreductase family protein [Chloroflexota bacterium]MDA1227064.1 nitroreductase family protein [Chloroflexota bacterium]
MNVYDCIRTRRTVRNFKPDPVPPELIHRLLEVARWSPTSSNTQSWHFVVVTEPETIKRLGEIATQGPFIGDAPLAIAVVMEETNRPALDAGRAIQQMELLAWSEGLGTCFVGFRDLSQQVAVKELLEIPPKMDLITVLPFGYRGERPKGTGVPRKPMSEMAHQGKFGVPYPG